MLQSIGEETRNVFFNVDRHLTQAAHEIAALIAQLGIGSFTANHLYRRYQVRRHEKMQAQHALAGRKASADIANGNAG